MDILSSIVKYLPTESAQIKFENMLGTSDDSGMNLLHTLEYFFIMLLLILNYDQILSVGVKSEFIIKLFIFLLPIFTLFRGYEILTREKDFFTITYAIILGYLCKINKNKYSKIVQFGTVIVCAYGFFRFIILFDNGAMMPYESYLFDSISIFR